MSERDAATGGPDDTGSQDDVLGIYTDTLARLASVRIDQPKLEHVLHELLKVTQQAMEASVAMSVTSIDADGTLTTVASTSDEAREVDAFEYGIDEGPCITALATGEEQLIDDVTTDERWPRFSEHAGGAGFISVGGLPLSIGERTIGALNLYSEVASGLEADLERARTLTQAAAIVLANGSAYRRRYLATSKLHDELDEIATVNQAIGMLMVQRRCDLRAAQQLLLAAAEATGRAVEDVAANIVAQVDPS